MGERAKFLLPRPFFPYKCHGKMDLYVSVWWEQCSGFNVLCWWNGLGEHFCMHAGWSVLSIFLSYVHSQLWLVLIPSIPLITPTIISTPAASLLQPAAISTIRQTHGQLAHPCPIQTGLIPQVRMTWGTAVWKEDISKRHLKIRTSRVYSNSICMGRGKGVFLPFTWEMSSDLVSYYLKINYI